MLEVYIDYVVCKENKGSLNTTIHFSTERGNKVELNIKDRGITQGELMSKYLSKYASGMYSKKDNKLIASSDFSDDIEDCEPYHLNYLPQYIESAFMHPEEGVSGYTIGSRNPIYGDTIKCTYSGVSYTLENNGTCFVDFGIYDENDVFMGMCPTIVYGTDPNQCVLEAIKEANEGFGYSVEDGILDCYMREKTIPGEYYRIDLEYDEDEILRSNFDEE